MNYYNEQVQIPKLTTINADDLMNLEFQPLSYAIDEILPQGIFILAGSGKIGKSWLSLDMCLSVAGGTNFWNFNAEQGKVLYLALEDNYRRLQSRLSCIKDEHSISNLHLATASNGINDGLIEQVKDFIANNPSTKFIIVDTLERIRNSTETSSSMYQADYKDINKLRAITDASNVTLLLIHHTRKMYDPDPLNTLTGSTGLIGSVDGVWVLEKESRVEGRAKLTIINRDTQEFCFNLEFSSKYCKWDFLGECEREESEDDILCSLLDKFLDKTFTGTATDLCSKLQEFNSNIDIEISNLSIGRKLKALSSNLKLKYGIDVKLGIRSKGSRIITLQRI